MAEPEYPVLKELETKLKLQWIDTNDYLATQRAIIEVTPDHAYLELPRGRKGDKGDPGNAISFQGIVARASDLPAGLTAADSAKAWVNTATKALHVWNGNQWFTVNDFAGVNADVQRFSQWFAQAADAARASVEAATRAEYWANETIQQVTGDFATRNYADSKDWVKAGLSSSDDLNLFTDPGIRPIFLGSIMSSLENRPLGFNGPGHLEVIKSDQTITQRLTQATSRGPETVERQTRQGAWGEWQTQGVRTRRMYYTDYNALPEGDYDIWTYAQARDMANRPPVIPSSAFVSTRRIGDQRMYQKVVGTGVDGLSGKWERFKSQSGEWREWAEVHTDIGRSQVEAMISASAGGAVDVSKVVTVGDSQVGASYAWANKLAGVSDLTVVNRGVGGYTPDEALIAAGAWTAKISQSIELPPQTDVSVSLDVCPVVAINRTRSWMGNVNGTSIQFKYLHDTDTFVLRSYATSAVTIPVGAVWKPDNFGELYDHRRIVWFGGNAIRSGLHGEGQTVLEHVQTAYSQAIEAWGDTAIVCGYVPAHGDTAGRDVANALNTWLERVVPTQFLDIRKRLQDDAATVLGRELTTSEEQDISNGYLPQAMYQSDLVHLLESVHDYIAQIMAEYPTGATPRLAI